MAIASLGTLGATGSTSAGASLEHVLTGVAEAGHLLLVAIAKDNASSAADSQTSEVTSLTDTSGGNTWTKMGEFCNSESAANAGATVSLWAEHPAG